MAFVRELFDIRHKFVAWLMLAVVLVLSAGCIRPVHYTFADNEDEAQFSFYKTASSAAVYFDEHKVADIAGTEEDDDELTTDDETEDPDAEPAPTPTPDPGASEDSSWLDPNTPFANAGGMLGFPDPDYDTVLLGVFSRLSKGEISVSYDTFKGNSDYTGMWAYAMYGHALTSLGLDESPGIVAAAFGWFWRVAAGGVLLISYLLASLAELFFMLLLQFLQFFNPFNWVGTAWDDFSDKLAGVDAHQISALNPLVEFLGDIFQTIFTFAQEFCIPIWGVIAVVTLLFQRMNTKRLPNTVWQTTKGLVFKVLFIFLAVPLMGSLYTATLDELSKIGTESSHSPMTAVLDSTLIDFENWAIEGNLALPSEAGLQIKVKDDGNIDWGVTSSPRIIALQVNRAIEDDDFLTHYAAGTENAHRGTSRPSKSAISGWMDEVGHGINFILRLMSNAEITEASYETRVKANIENNVAYINQATKYPSDKFYQDLSETASKDTYTTGTENGKGLFSADAAAEDAGSSAQYNYIYCHDGNADWKPNITDPASSNATITFASPNSNATGTTQYGLSTLSMYNYLASVFGNESMTVYSSHMLQSAASKIPHRAVNFVGESPLQQVINLLTAVTEFIALGIIGFGYGIAMVIGVVKNSIKLICALPMGLMGLPTFMARVLTLFVALIGEILLTIILFELASDLLITINSLISINFLGAFTNQVFNEMLQVNPSSDSTIYYFNGTSYVASTSSLISLPVAIRSGVLSSFWGGGGTGATNIPSNILGMLTGIFTTTLNGSFAVSAMRIRSSVFQATLQSMNNSMERVLTNQMRQPGGGGAAGSGGSGNFSGSAKTSPASGFGSSSGASAHPTQAAGAAATGSGGGMFAPAGMAAGAAAGVGSAAYGALTSGGSGGQGTPGLVGGVPLGSDLDPMAQSDDSRDVSSEDNAADLPDGTAQGGSFEDATDANTGGAHVAVAANGGPGQGSIHMARDGQGDQYGPPGSSVQQVLAAAQQGFGEDDAAGDDQRGLAVSHDNDFRGSASDAAGGAAVILDANGQPIDAAAAAQMGLAANMDSNGLAGEGSTADASTAPIEGAKDDAIGAKATATQDGAEQLDAVNGEVAGKVNGAQAADGHITGGGTKDAQGVSAQVSAPDVMSPDVGGTEVNTKAETGIGNVSAHGDKVDAKNATAPNADIKNAQGADGNNYLTANEAADDGSGNSAGGQNGQNGQGGKGAGNGRSGGPKGKGSIQATRKKDLQPSRSQEPNQTANQAAHTPKFVAKKTMAANGQTKPVSANRRAQGGQGQGQKQGKNLNGANGNNTKNPASQNNVLNPWQGAVAQPAANRVPTSTNQRGQAAPFFRTGSTGQPAPRNNGSAPQGGRTIVYSEPTPTNSFGTPGTTKQNAVGEEHTSVRGGSDDGNIDFQTESC